MLNLKFCIVLVACFSCFGCFEIVEEIDHNTNGSGRFSYLVNMSQSREKLSALLSLDSVNGLRIPRKEEIELQIQKGKLLLSKADGIHQVTVTRDYNQFIFTVAFTYDSIEALNRAAGLVHAQMSPYAHAYKPVFLTDKSGWFRQADQHTIGFLQNLRQKNPTILKEAKYTTVYRFHQEAASADLDAKIAGNKRAIMYSYNISKLAANPNILQQNIQLK